MAAALSRSLPHPDRRPRPKVVGVVGPVGRARAVELLAAGYTDTAAAHELGVDRGTVRRWRGEPDVAAALAAARRERETAAADALDDARRILAEAAPRAAQALVDGLDDDDPRVALAAAAALLDRVGMVKGAAPPAPAYLGPDARDELSARFLRSLTDTQLEQRIEELQENAARGRVVVYLPPEDPATG